VYHIGFTIPTNFTANFEGLAVSVRSAACVSPHT
jgi:hypothetical protein